MAFNEKIFNCWAFLLPFPPMRVLLPKRNVNLEVVFGPLGEEQLQNSDQNIWYLGWTTNMLELDAAPYNCPGYELRKRGSAARRPVDVFITRETGTNAFITALREAMFICFFTSPCR